MAGSIGELEVRLSARLDELAAKLKKGERTILGSSKKMAGGFTAISSAVKLAGLAIATLGGALIVRKLAGLVTGVSEAGDRFQKMSASIGVSTEALSELAFAAERSGTDLQSLQDGLRLGIRNLTELSKFGKGEAADALNLLSSGFRQLVAEGVPLEKLLPQLSKEFQTLSDADRVFVASKLFGRSGAKLIPLLTSDIQELRDRAKELGLTITQDAADAAAEFEDALTDLKSAFVGLQRQAIIPLLPLLTDLTNAMTEGLIEKRPEILRFFADFIEGAGLIGSSVIQSVGSIEQAIGKVTELQLQAARLAKSFEFRAAQIDDLLTLGAGGESSADKVLLEFERIEKALSGGPERQKAIAGLADSVKAATDAAGQRLRLLADDIGKTFDDSLEDVSKSFQRGEISGAQFAAKMQEAFGMAAPAAAAAGDAVASFSAEVEQSSNTVLDKFEAGIRAIDAEFMVFGDQAQTAADKLSLVQSAIRAMIEEAAAAGPGALSDLFSDEVFERLIAAHKEIQQQQTETTKSTRDFVSDFQDRFLELTESLAEFGVRFAEITTEVFTSLSDGIGQAVANAIVFGEDLAESLINVLKQVAAQIIATLVSLLVQTIIFGVLRSTVLKTQASGLIFGKAGEAYAAGFASVMAALPFPANVAIAPVVAAASAAGLIGGSLPFLAQLAEGGILTQPQLVLAGERGPEAVIPLDRLDDFVPGGSGDITIALELDGRQIAQAVVPNIPGVIKRKVGKRF